MEFFKKFKIRRKKRVNHRKVALLAMSKCISIEEFMLVTNEENHHLKLEKKNIRMKNDQRGSIEKNILRLERSRLVIKE